MNEVLVNYPLTNTPLELHEVETFNSDKLCEKNEKSNKTTLVVDTEFTAITDKRVKLLSTQVKFYSEDQFLNPSKHIYVEPEFKNNFPNAPDLDDDLKHVPFLQYLRDNDHLVTPLSKEEFSNWIIVNRTPSKKGEEHDSTFLEEFGLDDIGVNLLKNSGSNRIPSEKMHHIEIWAQFAQAEHGSLFSKAWFYDDLIDPLSSEEGVRYPINNLGFHIQVIARLEQHARLTVQTKTVSKNENQQTVMAANRWLKGFFIPFLIDGCMCVISYQDTQAMFQSLSKAIALTNRKRVSDLKSIFDRSDENAHNFIGKIESAYKGEMTGVSCEDVIDYAVCSDLEIDFIFDDLQELHRLNDPELVIAKSQGKTIQQHLYSAIHNYQSGFVLLYPLVKKTNEGRYTDFSQPYEVNGRIKQIIDNTGSPKNITNVVDDYDNEHRSIKKVHGGRAFSNHPLLQKNPRFNKKSCDNKFVIDTDISSAYANSIMSNMLLIGKPSFHTYGGKPRTLKAFLNSDFYKNFYQCDFDDQMIKNSFIAEIEYKELSFNFDFFASKVNYNDLSSDEKNELKRYTNLMGVSDYSYVSDADPSIKYFAREATNARLTFWDIDFLLNTKLLSEKQKQELLNKIKVKKFIYHHNAKFLNFEDYCNLEIQIRNEGEFFTVLDLGSVYIKPNLKTRKRHKGNMKELNPNSDEWNGENAKQEMCKLLNNGLYGLLCSDISPISSVITANNITSLCRVQVYAMEKTLGMFQSITDGGTSNLKVPTFENGLTVSLSSSLYKLDSNAKKDSYNKVRNSKEIQFKYLLEPLKINLIEDGGKRFFSYEGVTYSKDDFHELIALKQVEHVKKETGEVLALKNFNLELKGIFDSCTTFSTAHYYLKDFDDAEKKDVLKVRGQSTKPQLTYEATNDKYYKSENYFLTMMTDILEDGEHVKPPVIQLDTKLVKLGDIVGKKTLSRLNENRYQASLHNLTSLSAFTFINEKQCREWAKKHERDKTVLGHSFDRYFYNDYSKPLDNDNSINVRCLYDFLDNHISSCDDVKTALTCENVNKARSAYSMSKMTVRTFNSLKNQGHYQKDKITIIKELLKSRNEPFINLLNKAG